MAELSRLFFLCLRNARDALPIILVIIFFQIAVIGQPIPDLADVLVGVAFVLVGMTLFIQGLAISLFPLGAALAEALARRANLWLLMAFSFALGFGSTIAEPALIAVTVQAASAAVAPTGEETAAVRQYALLLRVASSIAVGLAVMVGTLKIIKGWPASRLVIGGYALAVLLAAAGDGAVTGIAFDAGAAATSAINIPLIAALGTGLATVIRDRSPLTDGFGLIALASVAPALVILGGTMVLG